MKLKFDLLLKSYHLSHRFVYKANPGNAGDGVIASATYDFFERNALTYIPYRDGERYSSETDILIFVNESFVSNKSSFFIMDSLFESVHMF